jgi:hypothetical protein
MFPLRRDSLTQLTRASLVVPVRALVVFVQDATSGMDQRRSEDGVGGSPAPLPASARKIVAAASGLGNAARPSRAQAGSIA